MALIEKLTTSRIRKMLKAVSSEANRRSTERFFKDYVDAIGVKATDIRPISREVIKWTRVNGGFPQALMLIKPLWKNGKLEERMVACALFYEYRDEFDDSSWRTATSFIRDLHDWASCDYLSADILGAHLYRHPDRRAELVRWTGAGNLWKRRAAAVSLVKYARKGTYLPDVWKVAAPLMPDAEDMVRKGVGWLLREAARTAPEEVVKFIKKHEHRTCRLIMRTAAETMPQKLKEDLLGRKNKKKKS